MVLAPVAQTAIVLYKITLKNDLTLYYTEQTKGDTKNRQVCKHFSRQVITVARRVYLLEVLQIFSDLKVAAVIVQTYNVLPNYTLLA